MTFHWGERPDSRATTSQDPTFIGRYVAAGTKDSAFVKTYALGATPPTVQTVEGTLWRNDIQVNPSDGPLVWDVDVFYGRINRQAGSFSIRWDAGVGMERRFVSNETVARYPAGARDYHGLMGVDGDRVDGTEAPIVSSMFIVEFKHPSGFFTPTYAAVVEAIIGHWNTTLFFGRSPGEMMLWSFRGSQGTDAETMIEYQFVRKPNLTNATIQGITGINKLGHDHLWFDYGDDVDDGKAIRKPVAAYVERVAKSADLAAILGFGA